MNNSISLRKGQKISLKKKDSVYQNLMIGLGWDVKNASTGFDFDLDVSCFMLDEDNMLLSDRHFIFYNNKKSPDLSVKHSGDDRTGGFSDDSDDETIFVELKKIDSRIKKILFLVTIHEAFARKQNFGQVLNSYIRVVNSDDNKEIAKLDLHEDFSTYVSVVAAELERVEDENSWNFNAIGQGYHYELDNFVTKYYNGEVEK